MYPLVIADIITYPCATFIPINAKLCPTGLFKKVWNKFPSIQNILKTKFQGSPEDIGNYYVSALGGKFFIFGCVQLTPGDHKYTHRTVEYSALKDCLLGASQYTSSIAFPDRLCCGADGGDWDCVLHLVMKYIANPCFIKPPPRK